MDYLLYVIIAILCIVIFALLVKIHLLRKSINEITDAFQEKLVTETNTLIDVSSRDPYVLKLASDINVQLRLLRKERQQFQQGDIELKEAITNLSHDLRTPLTAINGYLDLLDREDKSDEVNRYISLIRDRSEALKSLTEELFRYSIVTSVQNISLERIDLVRALEESLVSFYGVFRERNIEPEIRLPEEPVWKTLDKEAISRVFSNIISNAIKYSEGDFSVSMTESGVITFSNIARKMDAVSVGRLFDRFYTVETGGNSTGLGLSIAKILVNRMNGSISAEYKDSRLLFKVSFN